MAAPPFPLLFSPLKLGGLTLRNRVVVSPHTTVFATVDGHLTQREADYQEARARGGVALTVLGTNVVHPSSMIDYGVLANLDESYVPGYRLVAEAVHRHGALVFAQLNHLGSSTHSRQSGRPLQAPSPVPSFMHGEVPHQMEAGLIREVVRAFAAAAERCKRGGMDGVLVHAAHGYLLNQFLSPLTNRRADEYGGGLDGRLRLLLEVLEAIRAAVGRDYAVGVRLSVDEYLPGGLTLDESLEICRRLDTGGLLDYLDVSSGVDYEWMSHGIHYPGMHLPPNTWVHLAAAVKAAVRLPVSCAGRMQDPQQAEHLLAAGKLDLVQMARALIADPEWANKARADRAAEIRPCLYISSGCLGRLYRGETISCVQNPAVGREREYGSIPPAATSRRVVVVGGGPAGLEAAWVARQRGHAVVLFERARELGGQQRLAARAPGRDELLRGLAYLERELTRLDVDVHLGQEATLERVLAERPDAVIVATGSEAAPFLPPGADAARVCSVRAALDGSARLGGSVAVMDGLGRLAAASVADALAAQGKRVTMITRDYAVGSNVDQTTRPAIERRLRQGGVQAITGTEVVGFAGGSLTLRDCFTGREWSLDGVDDLVYDLGGQASDGLYHALVARGVETYRVGDCLAPRDLERAYHEGFEAAFRL